MSPQRTGEWKWPTRKKKRGSKGSRAPTGSRIGRLTRDFDTREKANGGELALVIIERVSHLDQNAERLDILHRARDAWNCSLRKRNKHKCGIDEVLGIEWSLKGEQEDREEG